MLVASNFSTGLSEAMAVLRDGGTPVQAVEAGIQAVEADPEEHSVGYSGYPNLLGQVELDACIMDGNTLEAGAVAGYSWSRHPISVARKVMEELPHVFLVGEGANRFAREMGFARQSLLTPAVKAAWRRKLSGLVGREALPRLARRRDLAGIVKATCDPQAAHDTVNYIAMDDRGAVAMGVSTSGWAWKYPGRVGDSAVIGAGGYADSRYGAACCTGRGEMAIRACASRTLVGYLKAGLGIRDACQEVMRDLAGLEDRYFSWVNLIAIDRTGDLLACSWNADTRVHYMKDAMAEPASAPMETVPCVRPSPALA